jgi:outer membrane protein TolC
VGVSTTSAKLLQAAADIAGGRRALAQLLGIGETLLERFMADRRELPDTLLLRAVDIVLAERQRRAEALPVAQGDDELQNAGRETAARWGSDGP